MCQKIYCFVRSGSVGKASKRGPRFSLTEVCRAPGLDSSQQGAIFNTSQCVSKAIYAVIEVANDWAGPHLAHLSAVLARSLGY